MMAMTEWVAPEQSCAYCHGEEGDFAGDDLYTKVVARRMIEMTRNINETWADHVAPAGVTCFTCHRGENVPIGRLVRHHARSVNSMAGWSANQNRVTSLSQSTSLPSDALQKYLVEYEPIRVHDLEPRGRQRGDRVDPGRRADLLADELLLQLARGELHLLPQHPRAPRPRPVDAAAAAGAARHRHGARAQQRLPAAARRGRCRPAGSATLHADAPKVGLRDLPQGPCRSRSRA